MRCGGANVSLLHFARRQADERLDTRPALPALLNIHKPRNNCSANESHSELCSFFENKRNVCRKAKRPPIIRWKEKRSAC